jgi:hypothetical protein
MVRNITSLPPQQFARPSCYYLRKKLKEIVTLGGLQWRNYPYQSFDKIGTVFHRLTGGGNLNARMRTHTVMQ